MNKILVGILVVEVVWLAGCASTPTRSTVYEYRNAPVYSSQPVYTQTRPTTQDDYNKKVIKQGLLGAATGAIAAEASGGKAGTGALVGAGTNVIGGALIDVLTTPQSQPQQTLYPDNHRVVRKFDSDGNIISEEVFTR